MPESQGISRRDLLKRGAALGGAVVWATPVVQTLGMGRAFAANGTPVDEPCRPGISYIAMCVVCNGDRFFIKWNSDGTGKDGWEKDPGATPGCEFSCPDSEKEFGNKVGEGGFQITENTDGCVTVTVPDDCEVESAVVFGGRQCDTLGPLSNGARVCCPGHN